MLPLPSPNCKVDFNYNLHGEEWKCGCNEQSRLQSPIDLPDHTCLKRIRNTPKFDYPFVKKTDIKMVYENNMMRLKPSNKEINLGTWLDIDGTKY